MRRRRPLERRANTVRDTTLVVIASEDRYAVKQYFDFFQSTRIQFKVLETTNGDSAPQHVLSRIKDYFKEYEIGEGDTFWLICDCDHWVQPNHIANLTGVLRECRQNEIRFALSNPCFDFWLLLHFADFPGDNELTCEEVGKRLRAAAGGYDKTKVYNLPIDNERVLAAVMRSAKNQPCNSEIPDQPQTAVHLLIQDMITQGIISVRVEEEATDERQTKSGGRRSRK